MTADQLTTAIRTALDTLATAIRNAITSGEDQHVLDVHIRAWTLVGPGGNGKWACVTIANSAQTHRLKYEGDAQDVDVAARQVAESFLASGRADLAAMTAETK